MENEQNKQNKQNNEEWQKEYDEWEKEYKKELEQEQEEWEKKYDEWEKEYELEQELEQEHEEAIDRLMIGYNAEAAATGKEVPTREQMAELYKGLFNHLKSECSGIFNVGC